MTRDERWLLEEKYGGVATTEFAADCARLALGEPVAYVIGWQPFLDLKIHLDSHPLIPRPETEHWVGELGNVIEGRLGARRRERQQFSSKKICVSREHVAELSVLDLCAGSGAIGCAVLRQFPNALVSFGEIDPAHASTIHKNVRANLPAQADELNALRADIRIGNLFEPFANETFDYIAINPPYIPEMRKLPASVADYEPRLALRAGADGLEIIRAIADALPRHLARGGQAWIECDTSHAETARSIFEDAGFSAALRLDQYGRPRVIVVSWSN